ncbi:hypothetical protein A9Q81_04360 [Gammaproteobacteria bacterium 42_54_T18]|nr:hypothetical protein A9Q81_04360 [Gammaproteobacteria bacterium 42_54_T18]
MSAVFSIIVVANGLNDPSLAAIAQLENEHVELLVCANDTGMFDAALLNAAVEQSSSKYTLILTDHQLVVSEEWLCQLANIVGENQFLGASGYSLLRATGVQMAVHSQLEEIAAVAPGSQRIDSGVPVEVAVALSEDFLFASSDYLRSQVFRSIDFLAGNVNVGSFIGRYSLRMKLNNRSVLSVVGTVAKVATENSKKTQKYKKEIKSFLQGYDGLFPINELGVRCWQRNADALRQYDEGIAASIIDGMFVGVDLQFKQKQKGRIVVTGKANDVILSDTSVRMDKLPSNETVVLFGIGAGELVETLLRDTNNEVLIVEPEAKLINYLWMRYDWSCYVENGRLRYMPIANEHAVLHSISMMQTSRFLQKVLDVNNIPTQVIRSGSYHLYPSFYKNLEVSLNWFLKLNRVSKTWVGKEKQVYDVTIVSPRCAIFVDFAECLHRLGVRTRILNVPDKANELTEDNIIQLLASLNVDASKLIVYRNRSFIESEKISLAAGLEDRIPGAQLSWWWDVPNVASFIDMQLAKHSRPAMAFANDILPVLPEGSVWLPPAAQSQFCTGELYQGDLIPGVSFVGQSRITHLKTQLKVISEILPIIGGAKFNELTSMFERFDNFNELYQRIVDVNEGINQELDVHSIKMPAQVYYLKYILEMAESAAFRVASIEALAKANIPLSIYGDDDWVGSGVVPKHLFKGIIQRKELRSLYEQSQLNLNLNFMQVSSTVNPKVLDIAACGGQVLTDVRPELDVLYPDSVIRPYGFTDVNELPDIVNTLLNGNSSCAGEKSHLRAIAERTRSHHSMENRARWLIENFSLQ